MNRFPNFGREWMRLLQESFLMDFLSFDPNTSPELFDALILAQDPDEHQLTLGEVVDRLAIPRPKDGVLLPALYEARPRTRIEWMDNEDDIMGRVRFLEVCAEFIPDADLHVKLIPEKLVVKPRRAAEVLCIVPEYLGEMFLKMGIRRTSKTGHMGSNQGKHRNYYLHDVLLAAAILLDRWEGRASRGGTLRGGAYAYVPAGT